MKSTPPDIQVTLAGNSLEELINFWQCQPYVFHTDETDFRDLIKTNPALEMVLGMSPCLSWIMDVRTQKFVLISSNIELLLGYKAASFRKFGLFYLNELLHPEDKKYVWRLTTDHWKEMQALKLSQRQNYTFNRKYRLRRADNQYVTLLEQNSVLQTDSNGNVTHLLSIFSDITDLRKGEGGPIAKIRSERKKSLVKEASDKNKSGSRISKREKQIIKLVAEGLSSKIIADKLFISYHTVNTHRRNIIEKTHTRNTSGLIQFAINNSII